MDGAVCGHYCRLGCIPDRWSRFLGTDLVSSVRVGGRCSAGCKGSDEVKNAASLSGLICLPLTDS